MPFKDFKIAAFADESDNNFSGQLDALTRNSLDALEMRNLDGKNVVALTLDEARYPNGATGVFITSTGEYPGTNRLEISGEFGKLVLENKTLKWWRLKESEREVCFSSSSNSPKIETEYIEFVQDKPETAHRGILQNFANAILHGDEPIAPGTDGINELMISNAAYLSAYKNQPVTLPIDEKEFGGLLFRLMSDSKEKTIEYSEARNSEYSSRWRVKW